LACWVSKPDCCPTAFQLQAAARAAENDTTNANNQTYNDAFRAGRDKMVHYMMRSMVQTTLTSLRAATSTSNAAKRAGHQVSYTFGHAREQAQMT
jgi:hypothetical protein